MRSTGSFLDRIEKSYPTTFEECVEQVIEEEGGYVNRPTDPGGETKYGISKRRFPREDIKNLTVGRAKNLYEIHYWKRYQVEKRVLRYLRYTYFDMLINHGPGNAVRILQRACILSGSKIKVDGGFGPKTKAAMKKVDLGKLRSARIMFFCDIVRRHPERGVTLEGWLNRVLEDTERTI